MSPPRRPHSPLSDRRPYDIREATDCHCVPGQCDCIEARVHAAQLTVTFNLRWDADMRAIKRWQSAHPGHELTWPDHADLVVWLMEQLESENQPGRKAKRKRTDWSNVVVDEGDEAP